MMGADCEAPGFGSHNPYLPLHCTVGARVGKADLMAARAQKDALRLGRV